jgi:sec-independent protein translocase protein TatC
VVTIADNEVKTAYVTEPVFPQEALDEHNEVYSPRPFGSYWSDFRRRIFDVFVVLAATLSEMPFLEHLEELRERIIKALIAVAASFVVCGHFSSELFESVAKPITRIVGVSLVINDPTEAFTVYLKVCFVGALYLSAPFVLRQAWRFIAPGLYKHERRYARPFLISTSFCFLMGGVFGYLVAFPAALRFLLEMAQRGHMAPFISAKKYFDLFSAVMIVLGIVIGLVNGPFLLRNTSWAVIISTIVAAVVTPTTDAFNMQVVAVPLILLYLIGVLVAFAFGRQRQREES